MNNSINPLSAVTAIDPYTYYDQLRINNPLYYDKELKLWIASSYSAISRVINSDICAVRPIDQPVPSSIIGSSAEQIYRHWIRMNEGTKHCPFKQAIEQTLNSVDLKSVKERTQYWANRLINENKSLFGPDELTSFAFQLPVYVMANILGVKDQHLHLTFLWITQLAEGLSAQSNHQQIEQCKIAAANLLNQFNSLEPLGLLPKLVKNILRIAGYHNETTIANAIGLIYQTYEATAGLITNTLVALTTQKTPLSSAINYVLRYDPPIQNTRRFVTSDGIIAGQKMQKGDTILLVLAAANRDHLLSKDPTYFTFGLGHHQCPGQEIAITITEIAVNELIYQGIYPLPTTYKTKFRSSLNARIHLFV